MLTCSALKLFLCLDQQLVPSSSLIVPHPPQVAQARYPWTGPQQVAGPRTPCSYRSGSCSRPDPFHWQRYAQNRSLSLRGLLCAADGAINFAAVVRFLVVRCARPALVPTPGRVHLFAPVSLCFIVGDISSGRTDIRIHHIGLVLVASDLVEQFCQVHKLFYCGYRPGSGHRSASG